MSAIRLIGVAKTFANGHQAVAGIDLEVRSGELLVLVGPSGCGKSTLLRLIAGLDSLTQGAVWIDDREVTHLPPQQRDLAMVFQSYALYPHMTVRENLAFALRVRRARAGEIERRVAEAAAILEIDGLLDRLPRQLSGGQRQRVALGRAIVRHPAAFLLDEPLSNLDASLRVQTRAELARLHRRLGATIIHVTHDQEEALTLGDRIAVLREGRVEQLADPIEVYRRPATRFVAGFLGSPAMNVWNGEVQSAGGQVAFILPGFTLPLTDAPIRGASVSLGVRPEDIELAAPGQGDTNATVDLIEAPGAYLILHLALPGGDALRASVATGHRFAEGDTVGVRFPRDRLHYFDAVTGRRL